MKNTAISIQSLSFQYENSQHLIFNSVDLELPVGCRTLLIGPNGCGKSTLLRILSGLHMIQSGKIRVLGEDPFQSIRSAGTRLVSGSQSIRLDLSVQEILSDLNRVAPISEKWRRHWKELQSLLGVSLDWRMHRLSSGQRQRVQILIALREMPRVLLLDEITNHLDIWVREAFLAWIKKQTETHHCSVLYATHVFDQLKTWPTHALLLKPNGTWRLFEVSEFSQHSDAFGHWCLSQIN